MDEGATDDLDIDEEPLTLDEVLQFHIDGIEENEEGFDGDMPDHGVEGVMQVAGGFNDIVVRADMKEASSEHEDPTEDDIKIAMREQALDMLAALANLQRVYDFDLSRAFKVRRAKIQAMQSAESMDDLQEAMDQAGFEISVGGVKVGDDVTDDDYDPEGRDRDVY